MLRCDQPAEGTYEVSFKHLHGQYGDPADTPEGWVDYWADIGEHGDTYQLFPPGHPKANEPMRDPEGQPIVAEPAPRAAETAPYVGELCVHELDWVRQLPGRVYNRNRRYAVRRLEENS